MKPGELVKVSFWDHGIGETSLGVIISIEQDQSILQTKWYDVLLLNGTRFKFVEEELEPISANEESDKSR
jgi:hypothetical protein